MHLNEYFDKIYLINLDKRTDRLKHAEATLSSQQIAFQRFAAVRPRFEKLRYEYYSNFEKQYERYIIGQCGCKMSHLLAVADAKANNYSRVLILEDDIEISKDIHKVFGTVLDQLEEMDCVWDMLYFGGNYQFGGFYENGKRWFQEWVGTNVQKLKGSMLAHGYGLTSNIYDYILQNALKSGLEIDNFYYNIQQHQKQFEYYGIVPSIITTTDSKSDIV